MAIVKEMLRSRLGSAIANVRRRANHRAGRKGIESLLQGRCQDMIIENAGQCRHRALRVDVEYGGSCSRVLSKRLRARHSNPTVGRPRIESSCPRFGYASSYVRARVYFFFFFRFSILSIGFIHTPYSLLFFSFSLSLSLR